MSFAPVINFMWSNKLITINSSYDMMPLPCCRLLMTGASLSLHTLFSVKTTLRNLFLNCPQPIPYVYPNAFESKVAFDWIYLICLRILHLLYRRILAIPAIVNTSQFVSNRLFTIVVLNCRTSRSEMFLNPFL